MKFRVLLVIIVLSAGLFAFNPEESNFANRYQYELLRSWQEKGELWNSRPAQMSRDAIRMDYLSRMGETITLEFDLSGGKIYNAREVIALGDATATPDIQAQVNQVGAFLYRFNTGIQRSSFEYADMVGISPVYAGETGPRALEILWREYGNERLPINSIDLQYRPGSLVFTCSLRDGHTFDLILPGKIEYPGKETSPTPVASTPIPEIPQISVPTPAPLPEPSPMQAPLVISPSQTPRADSIRAELTLQQIMVELDKLEARMNEADESTVFAHDPYDGQPASPARALRNYIYREYKVRHPLRNPHFGDPTAALGNAFPDGRVRHEGQFWVVDRPTLGGRFGGNLRLRANSTGTGQVFSVDPTCTVSADGFRLPDGEIVSGGNLDSGELAAIAPFITDVLYEHRALGTPVFHHLVMPDGIPTTLVFKGIERELFDFDSYSQMLMTLNQWWQGRPVYCHLTHFNKVNGYIEFYAEIAVPYPNSDRIDFAEARFHLDAEGKIDCSMIFLFPDIQFTRTP